MVEKVTLSTQMEVNAVPVILINKFSMKAQEVDQFLRAWATSAEIMTRQPGSISTRLHHEIRDSNVFVNYQVWESTEYFKRAFNNPEFWSSLEELPSSTVASPHLFKKVAVSGVCSD